MASVQVPTESRLGNAVQMVVVSQEGSGCDAALEPLVAVDETLQVVTVTTRVSRVAPSAGATCTGLVANRTFQVSFTPKNTGTYRIVSWGKEFAKVLITN